MVGAHLMRRSFIVASLLTWAAVLSGGPSFAAQLPLFTGPQDPSSLFSYLNTIVNLINANAVLSTGTPAAQGGNNNTIPAGNANGSTAIGGSTAASSSLIVQTVANAVDMIQIAGAPANNGGGGQQVAPMIQAVGTDTNIDIMLAPKGYGLVNFLSQASYTPAKGLTPCPGGGPGSTMGNGLGGLDPLGSGISPQGIVKGYFLLQNYTGQTFWVPACG